MKRILLIISLLFLIQNTVAAEENIIEIRKKLTSARKQLKQYKSYYDSLHKLFIKTYGIAIALSDDAGNLLDAANTFRLKALGISITIDQTLKKAQELVTFVNKNVRIKSSLTILSYIEYAESVRLGARLQFSPFDWGGLHAGFNAVDDNGLKAFFNVGLYFKINLN